MEVLTTEIRGGIVTESFVHHRVSRAVPGVRWSPEQPADGPVVLIGHGGSGSSLEGYVVALARRMTRQFGATCIAIDGPVHGARRGERSQDPTLVMLDFSQQWASEASMTDEMVADWRSVLDAVLREPGMADRRIGYWGLSMGTILGVPLVAAEPRISAAVLGLMGLTGPTRARLEIDAPRIGVPTMFLLQWDDELFDRSSVLDLFGAIGATDKQLHATPGRHSAVSAETFSLTISFLADRLGAS